MIKAKHPGGRPTDYNIDLATKICDRLAAGESMKSVCKSDDMPNRSTLFLWMYKHKEFADMYARAKSESSDALVEEMLDIADSADIVGDGFDNARVQAHRLKVDTRKWIASKLKPKKYGERIQHANDQENPVSFNVVINKDYSKDK